MAVEKAATHPKASKDATRDGRRGGEGLSRESPRELFCELVLDARDRVSVEASDRAVAYLVELLEGALGQLPRVAAAGEDEPALGEALLQARLDAGRSRATRLRAVGDRTLVLSGLFGEHLTRRLVDLDYYGQIGAAAYADLASCLIATRGGESRSAAALFRELAEHFPAFAELLAEVGDRTRRDSNTELLRLCDRYLDGGRERDRRRLVRAGVAPPPRILQ